MLVSQDLHQRRVDLEQPAFRSADIHAFLERFEQLREALLLFAMPGDVARQHTHTGHLAALDDGVNHAVVVKAPGVVLKMDLDHSRPVPLLQKPFLTAGRLRMQRRTQEFLELMTDQLGIRNAENFRSSAVHRSQGSIE